MEDRILIYEDDTQKIEMDASFIQFLQYYSEHKVDTIDIKSLTKDGVKTLFSRIEAFYNDFDIEPGSCETKVCGLIPILKEGGIVYASGPFDIFDPLLHIICETENFMEQKETVITAMQIASAMALEDESGAYPKGVLIFTELLPEPIEISEDVEINTVFYCYDKREKTVYVLYSAYAND